MIRRIETGELLPLTLTDLADGLGMPLTTAAGYVKRFEERGHVIKSPNPADGRSHLLSLNDSTRDWILDVAKIFSKTIGHFDAVMESEGVDSAVLVDQLQHVQKLIERALDDLENPDSS